MLKRFTFCGHPSWLETNSWSEKYLVCFECLYLVGKRGGLYYVIQMMLDANSVLLYS